MKKVNIGSLTRRESFNNFRLYSDPVFSIGTRLDVTELYEFCKQKKLSFFSVFLFVVTREINEINDFKLRIVDNEVVMFDVIHPSFIVMRENKTITTCCTRYIPDFNVFYQNNRNDIVNMRTSLQYQRFNATGMKDCVYISCLPWIDLVSCRNPYNYADHDQTSIPRITWSKVVLENQRYKMYFDISAHHALLDGYHLSQLINNISVAIANLERYLGD